MATDPNMCILVVDDFSTMRRIITNLLKSLGFQNLRECADGAQALEILHAEKIDFVMTDWNMPEMSGLELLKAIRSSSDKRLRQLPVLMVTAESLRANVISAAEAGVTNYIVKPFDASTLSKKIQTIFP